MISYPRADILAACAKCGPLLLVDPTLNGTATMAAITANESGGGDPAAIGHNCNSRQEPAYSEGGRYAVGYQAQLLAKYGITAACSWGPWQMMFCNFSPEAQDEIAAGNPTVEMYATEFVRFFNSYVIRQHHAKTISDIGQVWNGGHISSAPNAAVQAYVAKLQAAYEKLLANS